MPDKPRRLAAAQRHVGLALGAGGGVRVLLEVAMPTSGDEVSFNLVREAPDNIRGGRATPHEAARRLAEPCVCGISNPTRAAQLLEMMAGNEG